MKRKILKLCAFLFIEIIILLVFGIFALLSSETKWFEGNEVVFDTTGSFQIFSEGEVTLEAKSEDDFFIREISSGEKHKAVFSNESPNQKYHALGPLVLAGGTYDVSIGLGEVSVKLSAPYIFSVEVYRENAFGYKLILLPFCFLCVFLVFMAFYSYAKVID